MSQKKKLPSGKSESRRRSPPKTLERGYLSSMERSKSRILIVDDNTMYAYMCRKTLMNAGFNVAAITDADEALATLKSDPNRFDVVIADRTMPKLSGYKLAEALLEISPEVPIIISSGYAESPGMREARPPNIRAYSKKPFETVEFVSMVDTVLSEDSK